MKANFTAKLPEQWDALRCCCLCADSSERPWKETSRTDDSRVEAPGTYVLVIEFFFLHVPRINT